MWAESPMSKGSRTVHAIFRMYPDFKKFGRSKTLKLKSAF